MGRLAEQAQEAQQKQIQDEEEFEQEQRNEEYQRRAVVERQQHQEQLEVQQQQLWGTWSSGRVSQVAPWSEHSNVKFFLGSMVAATLLTAALVASRQFSRRAPASDGATVLPASESAAE